MIKYNDNEIKQNSFPDGALFFKFTEEFYPNGNIIEWNYENDRELFTLICLVNHIREGNPRAYIHLILPYIPHARMDRAKNISDIFTLKYFCQIINSLNFETVQVMDAHSNVSLALLDRVEEIKPWDYIHKALTKITFMETGNVMHEDREECYKNLLLFYPDEGAMKRYSGEIGMPYIFAVKDRDWKTGQIKKLNLVGDVSMIEGKNILIIDDICSKGGTFYHSAKALKEAGAKNIYLYITHCENTIFEGELLKDNGLIEKIFTTDSILTKQHEKIVLIKKEREDEND